MMTNLGAQKSGAFTLLENILALGIFMIAIVAIVSAITSNALLVDEVSEKRKVFALIDGQLKERARSAALSPGSRVIPSPDSRFNIEEQVSPLNLQNNQGQELFGLVELTITASIQNQRGEKEIVSQLTRWVNTGDGGGELPTDSEEVR